MLREAGQFLDYSELGRRASARPAHGPSRNPADLNTATRFLNLRVADIWSCYREWRAKEAAFLTEPLDNHGWELRCYMPDPDGYRIEVGQYTQVALDHFQQYAS